MQEMQQLLIPIAEHDASVDQNRECKPQRKRREREGEAERARVKSVLHAILSTATTKMETVKWKNAINRKSVIKSLCQLFRASPHLCPNMHIQKSMHFIRHRQAPRAYAYTYTLKNEHICYTNQMLFCTQRCLCICVNKSGQLAMTLTLRCCCNVSIYAFTCVRFESETPGCKPLAKPALWETLNHPKPPCIFLSLSAPTSTLTWSPIEGPHTPLAICFVGWNLCLFGEQCRECAYAHFCAFAYLRARVCVRHRIARVARCWYMCYICMRIRVRSASTKWLALWLKVHWLRLLRPGKPPRLPSPAQSGPAQLGSVSFAFWRWLRQLVEKLDKCPHNQQQQGSYENNNNMNATVVSTYIHAQARTDVLVFMCMQAIGAPSFTNNFG